jgi:hypothetical protein
MLLELTMVDEWMNGPKFSSLRTAYETRLNRDRIIGTIMALMALARPRRIGPTSYDERFGPSWIRYCPVTGARINGHRPLWVSRNGRWNTTAQSSFVIILDTGG